MSNRESFYWYDLETTGTNPAKDRIVQFAGLRTNLDLEVVNEPYSCFVQIPPEVVPSPEAIQVTRIDVNHATRHGQSEWVTIQEIHERFSAADTCVIGYNNINFDDEFIRYGFYRNFLDPYQREWKNRNSRMDLFNVVRLAAALRPEGIEWPVKNGEPVFKLEAIAAANHIDVSGAHDALVDVELSIGVARLLKKSQPRLWEYARTQRFKEASQQFVQPLLKSSFLHVSSHYGNSRFCIAPVAAIAQHPTNKNRYIVADLMGDLNMLETCTSDELRANLFTKSDPSTPRVPLYDVALNKCPIFASMRTLEGINASRIGIDQKIIDVAFARIQRIPDLEPRVVAAYKHERPFPDPEFAEEALYGGFLSRRDQEFCDGVQTMVNEHQPWQEFEFRDQRLNALLLRLKAHLRASDLSPREAADYRAFVIKHLLDEKSGLHAKQQQLKRLLAAPQNDDVRNALQNLDEHMTRLANDFIV